RVAAHGVAQQRLQLRVERAGDRRRTGEVLVLLLAQPTQAVGDVDPHAVGVGLVLAAGVNHRAGIDQHRAGLHLRVADLFGVGAAALVPGRAAGHDLGRAVRLGEVGHRPDGVELRLDRHRDEATPGEAVAVQRLLRLAGPDADHLGQVQDVAVAGALQEGVARGDDRRVHDQLAAGRRARDEGASARRLVAGKAVAARRRRLDIWIDLGADG